MLWLVRDRFLVVVILLALRQALGNVIIHLNHQ